MKKVFLILALTAGINTMAFSFWELWVSSGVEYGNLFETASYGGNIENSYMSSLGINLNCYTFWAGMDIGLFEHGIIFALRQSAYDFTVQAGTIMGFAFKFNISDKLKLQLGVGYSFMSERGNNYADNDGTDNDYFNSSIHGIGGDIGLKYNITDTFFVNIGSTITLDFASDTTTITSGVETSGWVKDYFMFGLKPYICIGINMFAHEGFGNRAYPVVSGREGQ